MNIKSLLLGSAAAFAVVSGAQAADAVVAAEPEPMEYVKVCDAYGSGFFYIPGTETCLKIGGQLRFEKKVSDLDGSTVRTRKIMKREGLSSATFYDTHSRIKLNVEAKNDSEWGTVYSWMRVQGDQDNNDAKSLNWYYVFGIGGLEFGNFDSQWAKFFGYGGFTDDGGVYNSDWNFGDSRQYISYTAEFGSVKAYVSVDNDADEFYGTWTDAKGVVHPGENHIETFDPDQKNPSHTGHKYMPDVEVGASATVGDWQVAGGAAYDESDESVALKGLIAGNFGMFGVRFMPLYSSSNQNIFFNYDGFSAILGVQAKVTDTITLSKDLQFWDNGDWRVVGNVNWEVASGFSVLLQGIYADRFDTKSKAGMLRFERSF